MRRLPAVLLAAASLAAAGRAGASLPGTGTACPLFPADNVWHADVSRRAAPTARTGRDPGG